MTDTTDTADTAVPDAGRIYYDAECAFCTSLVRRFGKRLRSRGFLIHALQEPGAAGRLGVPEAQLLDEMRVLTAAGPVYGGAEAVVYLAERIGWLRPLASLARLPGGRRLARSAYAWVASRRSCRAGACTLARRPR